jgi:hypothetical protein
MENICAPAENPLCETPTNYGMILRTFYEDEV